MSHQIKAGVATGDQVQEIFNYAKAKGFALPAVNVIGSDTINGVLETAAKLNAPVIIQFSNGGAIFNAGKGLSFLHKKGIIHRDVKPDNFITYRNKEGRLITKVTDLGLAKNVEASIAMTATENVMGTPYFMSPEQMLSTKNIDQRADIYSLGASLYEFMTGIKPFQDKESVMDILKTALQKESPISPLNHSKII